MLTGRSHPISMRCPSTPGAFTAVGFPSAITQALQSEPRPTAAQIVVNVLDLSGDLWIFGETGQPVNDHLRETAAAASVPVMAIRAVAAGALTDQLDRRVDNDYPVDAEFERAQGFRRLAADLGESTASLAHRYALSIPGVTTVVLGVKNRSGDRRVSRGRGAGPADGAGGRASERAAPAGGTVIAAYVQASSAVCSPSSTTGSSARSTRIGS